MQQGDTGLFSVRRPRETLGVVSHNASAIPIPSSAVKRTNSMSNLQQPLFTSTHGRSTSGSRMSLAPGKPSQPIFQRSSSGNNLAEIGWSTAHRSSTTNAFSGTGGRKSYAPVTNTPASALQFPQSTQRRSSVYSVRHSSAGPMSRQSFFAAAPQASGVLKDPRPLNDRGYQAQLGQELMDYLVHNNFEMDMKHALNVNTMKSPTQKDFNYMFQWLYHKIDPSYRFQKSIDAEVPLILKQLRYPFEKSITKSQIAAVGGQNWKTFLGMLHWMMQLARMMDEYCIGSYDDACMEAGFDVSGDRIIFQFLSDAYREWLSVDDAGADEDDPADKLIQPHIEVMAAKFNVANATYLEQVAVLEAEHKALQDQIDELSKARPQIQKLEEQNRILEEDLAKFEAYSNSLEARLEKYSGRVKLFEDEIQKTEQELDEAERERTEMQDSVDRQGITVQDIDRMNNERERLQKSVDTTTARMEESRKQVQEKELSAGTKLEELERAVETYNSLAYRIQLIPPESQNAKGQDYELFLSINEPSAPDFISSQLGNSSQRMQSDRLLAEVSLGYQPHHLLNLDLQGAVKSNILALRKEISERRNSALEEDMVKQELLDKSKEALEDREAEVDALGHKVRAAEEEHEKTKEISAAQKMASDAQIEKMEKELAKMRASSAESVQLMEQREMNTSIEYEQLSLKAAAIREELHTEIERMLNDVIKFKVHVQKSLEDYEGFVADEVDQEYEESETCQRQEGSEIGASCIAEVCEMTTTV